MYAYVLLITDEDRFVRMFLYESADTAVEDACSYVRTKLRVEESNRIWVADTLGKKVTLRSPLDVIRYIEMGAQLRCLTPTSNGEILIEKTLIRNTTCL